VGWVIQQGVTTLMTDKTPASAYDVFQFPVTLMTGEQSPIAARTVVDRLVRTIPGAKRVEIPGAGHMAPLAQTDKVNPVVLAAVAAA
jgi:pimeloyl-ACP methyl ester carboxylesterase